MHPTHAGAFLLLQAAIPMAVLAQDPGEKSIPEPTQLSRAVLDASADTAIVGRPSLIESDESTAEIAIIELVSSDDTRRLGVSVSLRHGDQVVALYLDSVEASQLRDELAAFDGYESIEPCEATRQCVRGVARCRPSQPVRQAFCPSLYLTADGKKGVLISTPGSPFRFPDVEPSSFVSAIDTIIGELNQ